MRVEFYRRERAEACLGVAAGALGLDGRVGDVEIVFQQTVKGFEDATSAVGGCCCNVNVATEGVEALADLPDVQVVDVLDAGYGFHARHEVIQIDITRGRFEQDPHGLAHDTPAAEG